jgi:hypothetical protein
MAPLGAVIAGAATGVALAVATLGGSAADGATGTRLDAAATEGRGVAEAASSAGAEGVGGSAGSANAGVESAGGAGVATSEGMVANGVAAGVGAVRTGWAPAERNGASSETPRREYASALAATARAPAMPPRVPATAPKRFLRVELLMSPIVEDSA